MSRLVRVLLFLALVGGPATVFQPAHAQGACLTGGDQRTAIREGRAVRPAVVRQQLGGKVLRLRLCRTAGGLVWQATTLGHNGRVVGHVIDAASGRRIR